MKKILSTLILVCVFLGSVSSFAQSEKIEPPPIVETEPDDGFELQFKAWQLVPLSLVLSPLILSTTQSDMNYLESFSVNTLGSVVTVASYGSGAVLVFVGIASFKYGIGIVPTVLGIGLWLGAPILGGAIMQETDNLLGAGVHKSWGPPMAVFGGSIAASVLTGLVFVIADMEPNIESALFGMVAVQALTAATTYALSRNVKQPPISISLPILRF